jgi:hypothetical protein
MELLTPASLLARPERQRVELLTRWTQEIKEGAQPHCLLCCNHLFQLDGDPDRAPYSFMIFAPSMDNLTTDAILAAVCKDCDRLRSINEPTKIMADVAYLYERLRPGIRVFDCACDPKPGKG